MMKILCFIDTLTFGGAQTQLVYIACNLKQSGHKVFFAMYHEGNHYKEILEDARIPLFCFKKKWRYSLSPILMLRKLIKKYKFDVILSFLATPSFYTEIASLGLRVKTVVSERNVIPDKKRTMKLGLLYLMHRFADVVTTNSFTHLNWLIENYPHLKSKLLVIQNGVDLDKFAPIDSRKSCAKSLSLLSVARIQEQKNPKNLAIAVAICKKKYAMPVKIFWAGQVVDLRCYQECCSIIKSNEIEDCWVWLGVRDDVCKILHDSDALIMTSLYEGHPNAICEALASGIPVLASDVCDNPIYVKPSLTGILFEPKDPEDIARAIKEFYDKNFEERKLLALNCRKFAEEKLSHKSCALAYQRLFGRLLSD